MKIALLLIIAVAAVAVFVLLRVRASRRPTPDQPTQPEPRGPQADDPRDRPAGPGAESQTPAPGVSHPGESRNSAPARSDRDLPDSDDDR